MHIHTYHGVQGTPLIPGLLYTGNVRPDGLGSMDIGVEWSVGRKLDLWTTLDKKNQGLGDPHIHKKKSILHDTYLKKINISIKF